MEKTKKLFELDLGLTYSEEESTFRVFSPPSESLKLRIYDKYYSIVGTDYTMEYLPCGIFEVKVKNDLKGKYYTYIINDNLEVTDPYSIATSIDSLKSAIIDLSETNPAGWEEQLIPDTKPSEAIIYELHIKDFSYSITSGVTNGNRGRFLGLVEKGTKYNGFRTGFDHLKSLGITHVHLMPVYDFLTVKEDYNYFHDVDNYNWGYDPEHFNVPEGSYSSKPKKPMNRIVELKKMIMDLHNNGIKVVMDVVYNHVYRGEKSNFEALYPGYYFRMKNGKFSNGTGVGNEMATEKPMYRKFILDSIKFWMTEYKIDGFRFDLMGLVDIDTMEEVTNLAKSIDPNVLIYGEPWGGGITPLPTNKMTLKGTQKGKGFACFNDTFRDCIKGDNNGKGIGFVMGDFNKKICVETGIVGSIQYDTLHNGFTQEPSESINYVNSHDDLILTDKINFSMKNTEDVTRERMNKLAFSIIFTSFGIPFMHEGNEFMRTKDTVTNTYNAPITMNAIDWEFKEVNYNFYRYIKDLIRLRKQMKVFSEYSSSDILANFHFFDFKTTPVIGYIIKRGDLYYLIFHNVGKSTFSVNLSQIKNSLIEKYNVYIDRENYTLEKIFTLTGIPKIPMPVNTDALFVRALSTEIYKLNVEKK